MKTVSIIIPFYNGEPFIHRCFCNICKQTYEHSAIECIFVNDGSIDNSTSLINNLISSNTSNIVFRQISHSYNQGVSAARNTGIKESKNEYIFFMDVDDTITENCLELLFHATSRYPESTIIAGNILNKKNSTCHHTNLKTVIRKGIENNLHDVLLFIYTSFSYNRLIPRDFIIKNNLFFPVGIPYFEDLQWNIDVARCASTIVYIPEITYFYEYVTTSAMSISEKRQDTIAKCYMSLIQKAMTIDNKECNIEIHIFIHFYIMKLLGMRNLNSIKRNDIYILRKRLFIQAIKLGNVFLIAYDLQLYQPFRHIANCKFVRNRSAELRLWVCNKTK